MKYVLIISLMIILLIAGCGESIKETKFIEKKDKIIDNSVSPGKELQDLALSKSSLDNALSICEDIEGIRHDWCVSDLLVRAKSSELALRVCENIKNSALKSDCTIKVAHKFSNSSVCDLSMDDEKAFCLAVASKNCSSLKDTEEKEECEELV